VKRKERNEEGVGEKSEEVRKRGREKEQQL
jgi:hypothetical protein